VAEVCIVDVDDVGRQEEEEKTSALLPVTVLI